MNLSVTYSDSHHHPRYLCQLRFLGFGFELGLELQEVYMAQHVLAQRMLEEEKQRLVLVLVLVLAFIYPQQLYLLCYSLRYHSIRYALLHTAPHATAYSNANATSYPTHYLTPYSLLQCQVVEWELNRKRSEDLKMREEKLAYHGKSWEK